MSSATVTQTQRSTLLSTAELELLLQRRAKTGSPVLSASARSCAGDCDLKMLARPPGGKADLIKP